MGEIEKKGDEKQIPPYSMLPQPVFGFCCYSPSLRIFSRASHLSDAPNYAASAEYKYEQFRMQCGANRRASMHVFQKCSAWLLGCAPVVRVQGWELLCLYMLLSAESHVRPHGTALVYIKGLSHAICLILNQYHMGFHPLIYALLYTS